MLGYQISFNMFKDCIYRKKELENFRKLDEEFKGASFEKMKRGVLGIEKQIQSIVGNAPDGIDHDTVYRNMEELKLLLSQRRRLLNFMFKETSIEIERMRVVNSRLFELTKRLRLKMADACERLVSQQRDDFDDDYEVEGTLRFSYNGEESILSYEGDDAYGSDYKLMIHLNDLLRFLGNEPYLELDCRYNDSRETILESGNCDCDDLSWAHETSGVFEGIYICHTTACFCRDFGYPIQDVLQLNDFWNEVHVWYQQFATQDSNYRYPRD